jgi:hypothetical protein
LAGLIFQKCGFNQLFDKSGQSARDGDAGDIFVGLFSYRIDRAMSRVGIAEAKNARHAA